MRRAATRSRGEKPRTRRVFTRKDSIREGSRRLDGEGCAFATLGPRPREAARRHRRRARVSGCRVRRGRALVTRDVPLGGGRALASARPPALRPRRPALAGAGRRRASARARLAGRWSAWREAAPEPHDVPDADTSEGRSALRLEARQPVLGRAVERDRSTGFAAASRGCARTSSGARCSACRRGRSRSPARRAITPRAAWGANESIRRGSTALRAVAQVRGRPPHRRLELVHGGAVRGDRARDPDLPREGNGWNDIGYNFVVDKYGQVFEGRYGGVERNVVGAHAEGFNTGSVGVALLGTYGDAQPTAEGTRRDRGAARVAARRRARRSALAAVVALGRQRALPVGRRRCRSRVVSGHRDTGFTSCPGNALYAQLADARAQGGRDRAAEALRAGRAGRVGGRSASRRGSRRRVPWTVTVDDAAGATVATGAATGNASTGRGTRRSRAGRATRTRSMPAPDVRPATGTIGQAATDAHADGRQARPATFTPNGDGQADSTADQLHAQRRRRRSRRRCATRSGRRSRRCSPSRSRPGRQTFRFTATGVSDGRYKVVLEAATRERPRRAARVPIVDRPHARGVRRYAGGLLAERRRGVDQLAFTFVLAAPAHVRLRIARRRDGLRGRPPAGAAGPPLGAAALPRREVRGVLDGDGRRSARARSTARFAVDTTKPTLRAALEAARAVLGERAGHDHAGRSAAMRVAREGRSQERSVSRARPGRSRSRRGTLPGTARRSVSGRRLTQRVVPALEAVEDGGEQVGTRRRVSPDLEQQRRRPGASVAAGARRPTGAR